MKNCVIASGLESCTFVTHTLSLIAWLRTFHVGSSVALLSTRGRLDDFGGPRAAGSGDGRGREGNAREKPEMSPPGPRSQRRSGVEGSGHVHKPFLGGVLHLLSKSR